MKKKINNDLAIVASQYLKGRFMTKVIHKSPEFIGGLRGDFKECSPHNFALAPTLLELSELPKNF